MTMRACSDITEYPEKEDRGKCKRKGKKQVYQVAVKGKSTDRR